ncbi:hypothetical protein Mgra_00000708 [Meloidogyne graminicola]|uniref:Uncharacterized protein n=1 Tax=Meloidogyne graminicola TaxID=189291 RepID=A0A8T0A329_9BILA|nr:hypothetical protein Mgra_00000708 [Meloidogyne graminicola]
MERIVHKCSQPRNLHKRLKFRKQC